MGLKILLGWDVPKAYHTVQTECINELLTKYISNPCLPDISDS